MKKEKNNVKAFKITTKDSPSETFQIPESGSLPLFALGYKGVMLWRAKKKALMESNNEKQENPNHE